MEISFEAILLCLFFLMNFILLCIQAYRENIVVRRNYKVLEEELDNKSRKIKNLVAELDQAIVEIRKLRKQSFDNKATIAYLKNDKA